MTSSDSILTLISRLEQATEGSRELDDEIALLHGWSIKDLGDKCYLWLERGEHTGNRPPHYTTSLDAALTLVPDNHSYELTQSAVEPPRFARARLWDWRRSPKGFDPGNEWKSEGNRPLPIAVCIASLKALSHTP